MTPRQLRQQREIRVRAAGPEAASPSDRRAAAARRGPRRGRRASSAIGDAALLLLLADVDLDIDLGKPAGLLPRRDQRVEQRRAVERMDRVEQADRLIRLVRLKPADHVQLEAGMSGIGVRGHLSAASATRFSPKSRDARRDQRLDLRNATLLGDRDQRHIVGLRAAPTWRRGDLPSRTSARRVAASVIPRAIDSGMTANQPPWPRDWLMTDERMGERLWEAIGPRPAQAPAESSCATIHSIASERFEAWHGKSRHWRVERESDAGGRPRSRLAGERLGAALVPQPRGPGRICPFPCRCMTKREAAGGAGARGKSGFRLASLSNTLASRRRQRWESNGRRSWRRLPAVRRLLWAE